MGQARPISAHNGPRAVGLLAKHVRQQLRDARLRRLAAYSSRTETHLGPCNNLEPGTRRNGRFADSAIDIWAFARPALKPSEYVL